VRATEQKGSGVKPSVKVNRPVIGYGLNQLGSVSVSVVYLGIKA
jgi:hypothetical protein